MKTYSPKPEHIERRWYVIDASDKVLGRVASEAAALLRGKHKPIFAPHMDTGDHVVVVNADKVVVTGGKEMKKFAYRHSGYPGGIKASATTSCCARDRVRRREGDQGHAAEEPPRPRDDQQAPCGCRARSPARRATAGRRTPSGSRPMWEGLPRTEDQAPAERRELGEEGRAPAPESRDRDLDGEEAHRQGRPTAKKTAAKSTARSRPPRSRRQSKTTARRQAPRRRPRRRRPRRRRDRCKAAPAETTDTDEE